MIRLRGGSRSFQLGEQQVMGLDGLDLDIAAGEMLTPEGIQADPYGGSGVNPGSVHLIDRCLYKQAAVVDQVDCRRCRNTWRRRGDELAEFAVDFRNDAGEWCTQGCLFQQ